jgi:hypothetical protein
MPTKIILQIKNPLKLRNYLAKKPVEVAVRLSLS